MSDETTLAVIVGEADHEELPLQVDTDRYDSVVALDLTDESLSSPRTVIDDPEIDVHIEELHEEFNQVASEHQRPFVEFVDSLRTTEKGLRLDAPLHGDVTFWQVAVDRFKSKSAAFDHSYNIVCRALAVTRVLEEYGPTKSLVLTGDRRVGHCYEQALRHRGHTVRRTMGLNQTNLYGRFVVVFVLGILKILVESGKTILARLVQPFAGGQTSDGDGRPVLLFTRSNQWEQYDWEKDRYYHELAHELDETASLSPIYTMHLSGGNIFSAVQHALSWERQSRLSLVHEHLGVNALIAIATTYLQTTWRLWRYLRESSDNWRFASLDVSPLVQAELLDSLYIVPHTLVQYECMRAERRQYDDPVVVTTHFESMIGRTTTAAVRSVDDETPVVGLQHGPIASGKLQYTITEWAAQTFPLPDRIVVDGSHAKSVLDEGGFPEAQITALGSPRYAPLFDILGEADRKDKQAGSGIVVFFGLSDFRGMASLILPVLRDEGVSATLKPHPSVRSETTEYIQTISERVGYHDFEIVNRDAHDLIVESDLVISSYSSTAIETLAFGTPLVCVLPRYRIDPTPFSDDIVPMVHTVSALQAVLDRDDVAVDPDRRAEFLDDFFGPRDGMAAQRLTRLCRELSTETDK
jgi:hypothetical protein